MDQARIIYESIINEGYDGLLKMIGRQDEHPFLDFKLKNRNEKSGAESSDRGTFAKAASGFSNSAGGVIVWGIDCRRGADDKDVVQDLFPIPNLTRFVSDLNQYLPQAIQPLNIGIENNKILIPESNDTGFVVTYIPESQLIPHRSLSDQLYYARAGDNFIKMEHSMLSDMFGKRQRPLLNINYKIERGRKRGGEERFDISIAIINEGRYVATYPAIRFFKVNLPIIFNNSNYNSYDWTISSAFIDDYSRSFLDNGIIWTGTINDVIHPTTSKIVTRLNKLFTDEELLLSDRIVFELGFEIYAEGCQPVNGIISLYASDFLSLIPSNK